MKAFFTSKGALGCVTKLALAVFIGTMLAFQAVSEVVGADLSLRNTLGRDESTGSTLSKPSAPKARARTRLG